MAKNVNNENLKKLKELTDELTTQQSSETEYAGVVKKLKNIVETGKKEIEDSKSAQSKIKCYETMCSSITSILSGVKIS